MHGLIVAGISTEVGKTVISAILTTMLKGHYWKPLEAGGSDYETVKELTHRVCYPPVYRLTHPLSPHHAAKLDNICVAQQAFHLPKTTFPLIIEGCGGVMSPLNEESHFGELFSQWNLPWVLVSKNYLGSINHTLLSLEWLKTHRQKVLGVIFNGSPNEESEVFILSYSRQKCLGRVFPEQKINQRIVQWYAAQLSPLWKEILM